MKKRFLGLICIIYSLIILYVILFDRLKYFLAPNMQIYLELSIIPLLIMGIIILLNNKISYNFKISDLILLLPVIMLLFAGDGRLTSNFASNRTTSFNKVKKVETKNIVKKSKKEKIKEINEIEYSEEKEETVDISNIYFDVKDESYVGLSNYITFPSNKEDYENKTIRVRGFVIKEGPYIPNGYFAIGKYTISCCAADAEFTGFIAKYDIENVENDSWYEVEGVLKSIKNDGVDEMYIDVKSLKVINQNSEEQYVYPCYSYSDGECSELLKYNLKY